MAGTLSKQFNEDERLNKGVILAWQTRRHKFYPQHPCKTESVGVTITTSVQGCGETYLELFSLSDAPRPLRLSLTDTETKIGL